MKKTVLSLVASLGLAASLSGDALDLSLFENDFDRLLNGIARDVAPTLRLGALSGDLQGDATIDHFSISAPALGFTAANGIATVLAPRAYDWEFVLPLSDLINDNFGGASSIENFVSYPSVKFAVGMGWNSWDFTVSGIWFPEGVAGSLAGLSGDQIKSLNPEFSFGNLGLQVRKTLIRDSAVTPALSLGAGYSITGFHLGITLKDLESLGIDPQTVGPDQTFDMGGKLGFTTTSSVFTVDLQISKHLLFLTPYAKLSGAYQNSTVTGEASFESTITDDNGTPGVPGDDTVTNRDINSNPTVNVSDFAFLTTTGLEINLFLCTFNVNVVTDVSRAFLKMRSLSFDGIDANAFSLNTGLRFAF